MKKVLISLSFVLSILLQTHFSYAQAPVRNQFTVTAAGNTITATLSGLTVRVPETTISQYKYVVDTKEIKTIPPWVSQDLPILGTGDPNNPRTTPTNGTITWTIPHLKGNTLYHVRIVEFPPVGPRAISFATADTTVTTGSAGEIFYNPAIFKKADSYEYELSGSLVISKHKSTDPIPLSTIVVSAKFYDKTTGAEFLSLTPIQLTQEGGGTYTFKIETRNFNPNTYYDLVVYFDSATTGAHTEHTYKVNTEKGIVPETGKAADNFFDKNSYRLLAPIPGMVALLDPALCQERKESNPGQICDVNAFLNFILKLIIGLAAVVLVVRLIIEGYSYMITDTPFKKASAKGNFKEALIGLVIALSSYLILNTINPRLVNNDLKIGVVEYDIKSIEDLGTDMPWTGPIPGGLSGDIKKDLAKMNFPSGISCPGKTGGVGDIKTIATSFTDHVTYSNDVTGAKARGNPQTDKTMYLDCSLYVNVVLGCAGITPKSVPNTGDMYQKGERISSLELRGRDGYINGIKLKPGDLIGHRDLRNSKGHVWIYIGEGEMIDSQVADRATGKSVQSPPKKLQMKPYKKVGEMNFVLRI